MEPVRRIALEEGARSDGVLCAEKGSGRPSRLEGSLPWPLVGSSPPMRELGRRIHIVAGSSRPVLVIGPTGSGKEVVVQNIHALGNNGKCPLLDLNCGALPASLAESQLFGHERGAFTSAAQRQEGLFSTVGEGTLFLDEIAELPLDLQPKLLRALESGVYRPIGSSTPLTFRGRVIAATHVDLRERVRSGRFREDLYYRLNVLEVRVPSLDERRGDIPALAAHFAQNAERPLLLTEEVLSQIQSWPWPGNVRQLKNFVDRLAVFAIEEVITASQLEALRGASQPGEPPSDVWSQLLQVLMRTPGTNKLRAFEEALVDEVLRRTGGNKTEAAQMLGVHRKVIERRVRRTLNPMSP